MLHERAGARARASADIDGSGGGAVPGRVAHIAAHGNAAPGIEPAHIGGRGTFHHHFRAGETHGPHTLAGVGHAEGELPARLVPEGAADVVLTRSVYFKFRFALVHGIFYGKQDILRGHALMIMQGFYT